MAEPHERAALPELDVTAATRHDYLAGAVPLAAFRRAASASASASAAAPPRPPPPPRPQPSSSPPSSSPTLVRLPLFLQTSAVLFPGHRMPVVMPRSLLLAPFPSSSSSSSTLAVVVVVNASAAPMRMMSNNNSNTASDLVTVVGCTAEVTHVEGDILVHQDGDHPQANNNNNNTTAVAIVTGRQRALVHLPAEARALAPPAGRQSLWLALWHAQATLGGYRAGNLYPPLVDVSIPLDGEDSAACGAPPAAAARGAHGPPKPFLNNSAFWPSWATRPFDARLLARAARERVAAVLPAVAGFRGAPAELGYFLSHNLPLPDLDQQRLLECGSSVSRLRALLRLLRLLEGRSGAGGGRRGSLAAAGGGGGLVLPGGGEATEEEEQQQQDDQQQGQWWHDGGGIDYNDEIGDADAATTAAAPPPTTTAANTPPHQPRLILGCGWCGGPLADAAQALRCTEEGVAGAFINAHGAVHDILTVRRLFGFEEEGGDDDERDDDDEDEDEDDDPTLLGRRRAAVFYQGRPETEHSWFPGYSWHICCCALCHSHLGWRFRRVEEEGAAGGGRARRRGNGAAAAASSSGPRVFWGLRRDSLLPVAPDDDNEESGSEDEDSDDNSGSGG